MNLLLTVFEIAAPVFLLAAIGLCLGQAGIRVPAAVRHPLCHDPCGAQPDLCRPNANQHSGGRPIAVHHRHHCGKSGYGGGPSG